MKVSYKWLQGYFEQKLPEPEKLAELITFGFAEVEEIEEKNGDTIIDLKILPDRACYALSHRGVAYEIAALTGMSKKEMNWPQPEVEKNLSLSVKVEAPDLCPRYMARRINGINPKANAWVKTHLEAVGQRLINPVVDGANLVMFDMGQPLHAFDADKVKGGIIVRRAKAGEKITTLDNREVKLDDSVLVIADHESPLAIAGIKGGKKAEVTAETKNLILESATFDAVYIRKTSDRLGIRTDASKRYENRIAPEQAQVGINDFTAYLFEMDKNLKAGEIVDVYSGKKAAPVITVTSGYIADRLGVKLAESEIEERLSRLLITVSKEDGVLKLTPPPWRLDMVIPEDVVEEVGRLGGYDKIPAVLPQKHDREPAIPTSFYYEWKIREVLLNTGFSEVMTSSFLASGAVTILKPLAEDKKFARHNLRSNIEKALKMNALNAPLFGTSETRIFEIGRIFTKEGERTALAIGYAGHKKKVEPEIKSAIELVEKALSASLKGETKEGVFECTLDFESLPVPKNWDIAVAKQQSAAFKPFSLFPFIARDIALFVDEKATPVSVTEVIKKESGKLLVKGPDLFDDFTKEGKRSLAFRLIFQAPDRTLTDEEVNAVMEKIYAVAKDAGWEVR